MINILDCPYPDLAPIFSLVRYLISIVSVVVPIILIVLGIIDFSKAVMAKDEKDIKTNQSIFIRRVIYAVAIFFVYTIVVFITNLVGEYIDEGATSWLDCFNLNMIKPDDNSNNSNNTNNDNSKEMACYYCPDHKYYWNNNPSGRCNNEVSNAIKATTKEACEALNSNGGNL